MYNDYKICDGAELDKLSQEYSRSQSKASILQAPEDSPSTDTPRSTPPSTPTYNFSVIGTALQQTIGSTLNSSTRNSLEQISNRFSADFPYSYNPNQPRVRGSINRRLFYITRLLIQASQFFASSDPYRSAKLLSYANEISGLYNMRII